MQRRKLLAEEIADGIRSYIASNGYTPGSQLPSEAALAERFNAGKGLIREVISLLKGEGLIEVRRGVGLFVGQPRLTPNLAQLEVRHSGDPHSWSELLNARLAMEVGIARLVLEAVTPADIQALEDNLAETRQTIAGGDYCMFTLNSAFHTLYIGIVSNRIIFDYVAVIREFFQKQEQRFGHPDFFTLERAQKTLQGHEQIVQAIKAGEVEDLRATIEDHILTQRVNQLLLPHVIRQNDAAGTTDA